MKYNSNKKWTLLKLDSRHNIHLFNARKLQSALHKKEMH